MHCWLNDEDPLVADRVLRLVLRPLVVQMLRTEPEARWFFIRYNERGPHLRFRRTVCSHSQRDRVGAQIRSLCKARAPGIVLETSVEAYEPELTRYGGPVGLRLSENHFHASSTLAMAVCADSKALSSASRATVGALAVALIAYSFLDRPELSTFFTAYASGYARTFGVKSSAASNRNVRDDSALVRTVQRIVARCSEPSGLPYAFHHLATSLAISKHRLRHETRSGRILVRDQQCASAVETFRFLLPSYIHMMLNRLGIHGLEEMKLASLLGLAFRDDVLMP